MNTISLDLTVQPKRRLRWSEVMQRAAAWWHCARSRYELQGLDDRCLKDIGMSPAPRILKAPNRFGCRDCADI
jgi:uncharacterized protein YjiS (DUF1127 family)